MEKQGGNLEIQGQKNNFKIHSQTYQTFPLSVYASLQQTNKRILHYLRFGHKIKQSGFLILKPIHTELQSKHLLISTHRAKPSAREEQPLSNSCSAVSHQRIWNSAHDLKQWLASQTRPWRCAKSQVRAVALAILFGKKICSGRGYTYTGGHWKMRAQLKESMSKAQPLMWNKGAESVPHHKQSLCVNILCRGCAWITTPMCPSKTGTSEMGIILFWLNN